MSGDQAQLEPPAAGTAAAPNGAQAVEASSGLLRWKAWRDLWQAPSIAAGLALIVAGIYTAVPRHAPSFAEALNGAEALIHSGEIDRARQQLVSVVQPQLASATLVERARFHQALGDVTFLHAQAAPNTGLAAYPRVVSAYEQAAELGLASDALRLERWAESLLALEDLEGARQRLAALNALEHEATAAEHRAQIGASRNRLFRSVVETSLRQPGAPFESLMQSLAEYRMHGMLTGSDELWAIGRQTELRLAADQPALAVDLLLVELRRLEARGLDEASAPDVGELHVLLARGYFELAEYDRADAALERAMSYFTGPEPGRGEALTLQGELAAVRGHPDAARELFEIAVRDFTNTPCFPAALLGRAESCSILGEHEQSLADYRAISDHLSRERGGEVTPARVAQSLCDRHDIALAMGKLDVALSYIELAQNLFGPDDMPADVLIRLASTNRQLADNLVQTAQAAAGEVAATAAIDPAVRFEANTRYERAAQYYQRHSAAAGTGAGPSSEWAVSLWMAGESFDRAGQPELAIEQFRRYLDAQPSDDPRRPETVYRMGQSYEALTDAEHAAEWYDRVIADHPRSPFAAQSYVPLARCLIALGRRPEAVQHLRQVLAGDRLLKPDARDYRDALIELGRIVHSAGEYTQSIELFTQAVQRYPDDPRRMEVRFLLADSYRGSAAKLHELAQEPGLSPTELARLSTLRIEQLHAAQDLFASIVDEHASHANRLDIAQLDMLRRAEFYRADCAFAMGQYEQAIGLYDHAARQYSAHHSSMYALIQIVNCYAALRDDARMAAAHHRALVRLRQLPESVFDAPDALLDRRAWEQWLEHTPVGPLRTATADASSG